MDIITRLVYLYNGEVIDAGVTHFEEDWYDEWLDAFVKSSDNNDDEELIVFAVVHTFTTDVDF